MYGPPKVIILYNNIIIKLISPVDNYYIGTARVQLQGFEGIIL